MLSTIVVGLIFVGILFFAGKKTFSNMKNNQCNCGTSCSSKSKCHAAKR
nr:FeoB-associated Cys-rich membrane protein [uncultured Bacillus sp.]